MPKNEVTADNPALQQRFIENRVAKWCGVYLPDDRGHPTPEFHLDIYDLLISKGNDVVKAPRSFAKSVICCKNFPTYLCCEYPKLKAMDNPPHYPFKEIMILGANGKQARKWLRRMRIELTKNEAIVADYGDMKSQDPELPWNNDEFYTKDGVHVMAFGAGMHIRGERPEIIIGDDLDDDEAAQSDEQIDKMIKWWDSAVINTLDETHCKCLVIGTTIEEITLLEHICQMPSFTEHHYGAYLRDEFGEFVEEAGYELWPSKWSHERLLLKLDDIKRRAFSAEFLNVPMSTEAPIFERHWFKPYDVESVQYQKMLDNIVHTIETCDPAISRSDGADFTALVNASIFSIDNQDGILLRTDGVKQGHWSLGRTVTEIVNFYDKFMVNKVGVESVAYQEALGDEVEAYMDAQRRNITVVQIKVKHDKERRANAVAPIVERGMVYYNPNDPMHVKLINQCVRFKAGKKNIKKDLMDAFVHLLKMYKDWAKYGQNKTTQPTIVLRNPVDPRTGRA